MKQVSLRELEETIGFDNYNFSIEPDDIQTEYNIIWDEVVEDLVHWCCGQLDNCLTCYIHHFNMNDEYIDSYTIVPTEDEMNELRKMCNNWDY